MARRVVLFIVSVIGFISSVIGIMTFFTVEHTATDYLIVVLGVIAVSLALLSLYLLIAIIENSRLIKRKVVINTYEDEFLTLNYEITNINSILRITKQFIMHTVDYIYEIKRDSFTSIKHYVGEVKRNELISGFPFILAGDKNSEFSELHCYAFDLERDPERIKKIVPKPIKARGMYQRAEYPFERLLGRHEKFNLEIYYTWPECVNKGWDYIYVSPNAKNKSFTTFNVELRFWDNIPRKVYKYGVNKNKKVKEYGELIKSHSTEAVDGVCYHDYGISIPEDIYFYVYVYEF